MARLFGILGNRSDLAGRALLAERTALKVVVPPTPSRSARLGVGWGVGFHQNGEVLLRRRPSDEQEEIDLAKQLSNLRASVLFARRLFDPHRAPSTASCLPGYKRHPAVSSAARSTKARRPNRRDNSCSGPGCGSHCS